MESDEKIYSIYLIPIRRYFVKQEGEKIKTSYLEEIRPKIATGVRDAKLKLKELPEFMENWDNLPKEEQQNYNAFDFMRGKVQRASYCKNRLYSEERIFTCKLENTEGPKRTCSIQEPINKKDYCPKNK